MADIKAQGNEKYHAITAGTVTASKALVVDANKDLSGIRNLTITGNLVTGSNTLSNAELAVLDGVTAGTVTASKALVVDASKNLATLGAVTTTGLTSTTFTVASGGTIVSDKGTVSASGSGTAGSATLNTMAGVVTTTSMSAVAGATYVLTITNSLVAATDIILCTMNTASAGTPLIKIVAPSSGSFAVTIHNAHATVALNNTAAIAYLVIK